MGDPTEAHGNWTGAAALGGGFGLRMEIGQNRFPGTSGPWKLISIPGLSPDSLPKHRLQMIEVSVRTPVAFCIAGSR
jgi:hypothetical protein